MFCFQKIYKLVLGLSFGLMLAATVAGQTTVFTYQGRMTDSTQPQPTNGIYEMQFKLYDAATVGTGNQGGITQTITSVSVVNGIFTVQLDQGGTIFRSVDLFVEIAVRPSGSVAPFTVLAPRQQISTAPLAIRSRISNRAETADNSDALGGLPASSYVQTSDTRLADDRNPLAGSANYIQNQSAVSQAADLKISGNATIGGNVSGSIVEAGTQFNLSGGRFLSGGSGNVIAGINAGSLTTTGGDNSFFGTNAGKVNVTGFNNAFFGTDAGRNNTASSNSFFGRSAGFDNTTGTANVFFGLDAGRFNTSGQNNSFIGNSAGRSNTIGVNNTFNGLSSGFSNTQGTDNSFVGLSSGFSNTLGSFNTFSGRSSGQNNSTGNNNSFFGTSAGGANTTGSNNSALGYQADVGANNLNFATAIGSGSVVSTSDTIALGRSDGSDTVRIFGLATSGSLVLCRNASNQISTCTAAAFGGTFINNSTVQQPVSNFNVSGNGTAGGTLSANIVNSTTNFRIGGVTVFSTPSQTSVVAGQSANHTTGAANSAFYGYKTGAATNAFSSANTFIGSEAGGLTTSGGNNTFVGKDAGYFNSTGSLNSFFGSSAGKSNTTADANSFFGYESGLINSTGARNSFFGFQAGRTGATAGDNSFFGYQAGTAATGGDNAFFGSLAGAINTSGDQNTFVGGKAGNTNTTGSANTFLGFNSGSAAGSSNTIIGVSSDGNGSSNTVIGASADSTGDSAVVVGAGASSEGNNNTAIGSGARVEKFDQGSPAPSFATAIGAGAVANLSNAVVIGRSSDFVRVPGKLNVSSDIFAAKVTASLFETTGGIKLTAINSWTGGDTPLCRNGNNLLSNCPPSFSGNGITIEQAAQIKEQQVQITAQAEQLKQQKLQIEALTQIVCAMNPKAELCIK